MSMTYYLTVKAVWRYSFWLYYWAVSYWLMKNFLLLPIMSSLSILLHEMRTDRKLEYIQLDQNRRSSRTKIIRLSQCLWFDSWVGPYTTPKGNLLIYHLGGCFPLLHWKDNSKQTPMIAQGQTAVCRSLGSLSGLGPPKQESLPRLSLSALCHYHYTTLHYQALLY